MKVKIRNANEMELENIANIYVSSWKKAFSKFLLKNTINKLNVLEKQQFLKDILLEKGDILIAENNKNKEICSYIVYENISKNSIEIISFYISPLYVKENVANQLLNNLKLYCKDNYISNIVLWTFRNNKDSINFYKSLGFYETGFERQSNIEIGQIEVQYILKNI